MESHSLRNSITISPEAAELLRTQAPHMAPQIIPRGLVEVKGKGLLELFLLRAAAKGRLSPPETIAEDAEPPVVSLTPQEEPASEAVVWVDEAAVAAPGRAAAS